MVKPKRERPPFEPSVVLMVSEENGKPMRWDTPKGFTLSWDAKGWGFGLLSFGKREDGIYCGDEYMGLGNARMMLARFCAATPEAEWPLLLREYGGAEQIMAAVVDWESKPREAPPQGESSES